MTIFIGDTAITDPVITPTSIRFRIPAGASGGLITARYANRNVAIGDFQVANYDAKAEAKKRREERRKAAEAQWQQRRRDLAKDRATRLENLRAREAELAESRAQRREARQVELRARFEAAFLADEATLAELAFHAERMARLDRMTRLAEANQDGKLVVRISVASAAEQERHDTRIATLKSAFKVQ